MPLEEELVKNEELDKQEIELNENDVIIDEGESFTVTEHDEEYLAFSIDGLYSNKKENQYKRASKLRKKPPVLEISTSSGTKVTVPLTYNFNKSLLRVITEVNYAYIGMKKTRTLFGKKGKKKNFIELIKDIIRANKLALGQLFLGCLLGIGLAKGSLVTVVASLIGSAVLLVVTYTLTGEEDEGESNNG